MALGIQVFLIATPNLHIGYPEYLTLVILKMVFGMLVNLEMIKIHLLDLEPNLQIVEHLLGMVVSGLVVSFTHT